MQPLVGRYAPSPTGPLHLGNLRTALLAWLQARLQGGAFLVRMEDLDQPRVVPGSDQAILQDLEWLGIDWDGSVLYQSTRQDAYQDALASLEHQNLVYPCYCSRKDLRGEASAPHGRTPVYSGTCASLSLAEGLERQRQKQPSLRLRVNSTRIECTDAVLGALSQDLSTDVGDFVVKRADKLFAYQLAVVVDDLAQGVSHIVRGADLADSSCRQHYIAKLLAPDKPDFEYWHVPLKNDDLGQRMAKRDGAASLDEWRQNGRTTQQLIGEFAFELGLLDSQTDISAAELLTQITLDDLRQALRAATYA